MVSQNGSNRNTFLKAEIMKKILKFRGFCFALVFLALCACHKQQVFNTVPLGTPGTVAPPIPGEYKINVGDRLSIKLFYNPELNQEVIVRPDGRISLPLVKEIKAAGMTPGKLTDELTERYEKYVAESPELSVIVLSTAGNKIFVGGEVNGVSVKELSGPTTVMDAIVMSGGWKDTGDRNHVIVVRRGEGNKPVYLCLDVEKATKGIDPAQDIYLEAYDMVIVPRSGIADVNLWVQQYIGSVSGAIAPFAFYGTLGTGK